MARAFSLQIDGVREVIKKLKDKGKAYEKGLKNELHASGLNIQRSAKQKAPRDMGLLAQRIVLQESGLTIDVVVGVGYGAYVEFGTGGRVSIPAGFETYAAQFKGSKGGTFREMVDALTEWVHRNGITGTYSVKTGRRTGGRTNIANQDRQAAYAIAISILRKGLKPHPFLIPAYLEEKPKLINRIKQLL